MQKTSLGIALLMSCSLGAFANPVSVQTAQKVAENFIAKKISASAGLNVQLTKTYTANGTSGQSSFYIFDVNNGTGFVIVSGEDAVTPILGYSSEARFPAQVTNNEVSYWMDGYNEQISTVIDHHVAASASVTADWNKLLDGKELDQAKGTTVSPLVVTKWDQGDDYATLCPTNTPTGCVATAMAQIMKFWNYPDQGVGNHSYTAPAPVSATLSADFGATTYHWADMPIELTASSTTSQKQAIATLMSHVGISVNMSYDFASNGGSGSFVISSQSPVQNCSEYALKTYFKYSTDIKGTPRSQYANNDAGWLKLLQDELEAGRPILYTGFGSAGGHAFVFDGYDQLNRFHINWGWGGMSNGYFVVDNLAPPALGIGGGGGNFNNGQQALTKIIPNNITKIVDVDGAEKIATYPNPTSDLVNIDLTQFQGKVSAVQLFNIQGQKVLAQDVKANKVAVPVSQVAQGMYLLHLQSDKGTIIRKVTVVK